MSTIVWVICECSFTFAWNAADLCVCRLRWHQQNSWHCLSAAAGWKLPLASASCCRLTFTFCLEIVFFFLFKAVAVALNKTLSTESCLPRLTVLCGDVVPLTECAFSIIRRTVYLSSKWHEARLGRSRSRSSPSRCSHFSVHNYTSCVSICSCTALSFSHFNTLFLFPPRCLCRFFLSFYSSIPYITFPLCLTVYSPFPLAYFAVAVRWRALASL